MFNNVNLGIPAAITADSLGQNDEAILAAVQWIIQKSPDEPRLVSLASKEHLDYLPLVEKLSKRRSFSQSNPTLVLLRGRACH